MNKLQPYFLFCVIAISSIIVNNAIASPVFFQCQLKNGHMTFSDKPCLSNQKAIPAKKSKKSIESPSSPTIDMAGMSASTINNPKDCAYLDRLGIKRKYDHRNREAHLKYWRADQADELKQELANLDKMKDKELEGC